jgi:hypothetical protein
LPCKGNITIITFSIGILPFQGGVLLNLTRRVAAGWLVLPFQGGGKLGIFQNKLNYPLVSPTIHY